jgi:hypothetical protein
LRRGRCVRSVGAGAGGRVERASQSRPDWSSHEVRTAVAGGAARLCEQATGRRALPFFLPLRFRPAKGGPSPMSQEGPPSAGREKTKMERKCVMTAPVACSPKRLAAPPATIARPPGEDNGTRKDYPNLASSSGRRPSAESEFVSTRVHMLVREASMFRVWSCVVRFAWLPFLFIFALFFPAVRQRVPDAVSLGIICATVSLGLLGAVLGVLMALGRIRWRCPCCGCKAPVYARRFEGMWMECKCGSIRCGGLLGLTVRNESLQKNDRPDGLD